MIEPLLTAKVDIERYLAHSQKIETEDLHWSEAQRVGLTDQEVFILTYFADIEGQTIMYLRDLLNTKSVEDPDTVAFLTMWNYEEFFHGKTLARLLEECGHPLSKKRIFEVRKKALLKEKLIAIGAKLFSKLMPKTFLALYMSWGAINELTTLRGYEALQGSTQNPTLKILCERIAKQERRHFAWYYNSAAEKLEKSSKTQKIVRFLLKSVWSPVGAGVKKDQEVYQLIDFVFPGDRQVEMARDVDTKTSNLPGLKDLHIMQAFVAKMAY